MEGVKSWRLIVDPPITGADNLATDEAILRLCEKGLFEIPTLRLYEWKIPTLSIGYAQNASSFSGLSIPLLRRITGGRAVLHHMELTYSIVCGLSEPLFSRGIHGAYSAISRCILNALKDIGVSDAVFCAPEYSPKNSSDAEFKQSCFHAPSRHEILAQGRKMVGSAQRRFKRAFLQHGSILFDVDKELVESVFGRGSCGSISWVGDFSKAGKGHFKGVFIERMEEGLGADFKKSGLTGEELYLKDIILRERYLKREWNINGAADTDKKHPPADILL